MAEKMAKVKKKCHLLKHISNMSLFTTDFNKIESKKEFERK